MSPRIPEGLRALAMRVGVTETDVDALWQRHIDLVNTDGGGDYGGPRWKGLCERHVRDEAEGGSVQRVSREERRDHREAEARAKKAADEAYEREAISLEDYQRSLITKDELTEAEQILIDANRQPGEDVAAFMARAFADGPRTRRANVCATPGCPSEGRLWWSMGRQYQGALCGLCEAQERERLRRGVQP